jgi:tetratricopeptide (TPR) repeat protein
MTEWFRNKTWNETIERTFNEKLRRARRKEQYLRIQAGTLASSHAKVALKLLDQYFSLKDDYDHAQAHVDRARAFVALGRIDQAIESYEAALKREAEFPSLQTQAWLDLPYLIATRGISKEYDRALQLLRQQASCVMFPVDRFRSHAAQALIAAAQDDRELARENAESALKAAAERHSGFRYHASVGLVTEEYENLIKRLEAWTVRE